MIEVLRVEKATKQFDCGHRAVNDVSFSIAKGECVGLVGESGSGKSTLAKCVLLMEEMEGSIWLNQQPVRSLKGKKRREARKQMQAVFQNPAASLNPKLKIIESVMEPLDVQKNKTPSFLKGFRENRERTAAFLMKMTGLDPAYLQAYPHELSGGEKQRAAIARAVSTEPDLIVLDEPTASLDVLVQADILKLLQQLQKELQLSYLFISHDLAAVQWMSDRILVMRSGQIEDEFPTEQLFAETRHSYTKKLIYLFEK